MTQKNDGRYCHASTKRTKHSKFGFSVELPGAYNRVVVAALSPIISREGNDAVNFGTNQDEFETAVEDDCSARRTGVLRAYSMSSARCVGRYGRGGCWRAALQLEGDWCLSSGKQAGGGGPAVHGWSRRPTERHHWPQGGGPARCRDAGRRQRVRCEQDARGPGCSP